MDLRLDQGQSELQDTVQRFCADRFALDRVGEREGRASDRAVWKELGELGVLGLLRPEPEGGSGLGALEAAVVFEQLGAYLATGPVLWSVLAAPLVDGVATGDRMVGGIDEAGDAAGDPLIVEHAAEIDTLLVLRPEGVFACPSAELSPPQELTPLDPLTPVGRLAALPPGNQVGGPEAVARTRLLGTVLSAALLLGVSARALEVARSYALERQQFGVSIGSFQAIKHLLADMYVRTGMARSATYAAAAVMDDPAGSDPAGAVSAAKLLAGEAAINNASAAVQVLGGMGFTWEMLPNYLLKRAWVLEHTFGTADQHALAIGSTIGEAIGGGTS